MSRFAIIFAINLCYLGLYAQQINNLKILSPTSIAGNYEVMRAEFGSRDSTTISASAVFVDDDTASPTLGCQDPINNISGKIAFIDRGFCEFGDKALRAQKKGAIAVVICGSASNITQTLFPMSSGSFGSQVTIPSFMLLYNDCVKIRTYIVAGGLNVTLENTCFSKAKYPSTTIWGNMQGQGDFNNGLNEWTIDKINTWTFLPVGELIGGAFGSTTVSSWTSCNGVMGFFSDFLDNGGNPANQGGGLCPAPCTGALISPTIDISSYNVQGLAIEFSQASRQFLSKYWLLTSKDGGLNWDSTALNKDLPVNSLATSSRNKVALAGYEATKSIKIKFVYEGNYYYWAIDDVIILNEKFEDVIIKEFTNSGAPSLKIPRSQVSEMLLSANVTNIGNADATNTKIKFSVKNVDNTGIDVFSSNQLIGNLTANNEQKVVFSQTFTPPMTNAEYQGVYEVSSDNDTILSNNKVKFNFFVTENVFSNTPTEIVGDNSTYLTSLSLLTAISEPPFYHAVSNVYHIVNGKELTIDSLVFGLSNSLLSDNAIGQIEAVIYEWNDANNDNKSSPNERAKVGGNFLDINNKFTNTRKIAVPIWASLANGTYQEGTQFELKDNTDYMCVIRTLPIDPTTLNLSFLSYQKGSNGNNDFQMCYKNQREVQNENPNFAKRYAGSIYSINSFSPEGYELETYASLSLNNYDQTVFIDAYVGRFENLIIDNDPDEPTEAKAVLLENPVQKELTIDIFLLEETLLNATLVSKEGQLLYKKSYQNFKKDRIVISVENIPSGVYTLKLQADNTIITKEIVVVK